MKWNGGHLLRHYQVSLSLSHAKEAFTEWTYLSTFSNENSKIVVLRFIRERLDKTLSGRRRQRANQFQNLESYHAKQSQKLKWNESTNTLDIPGRKNKINNVHNYSFNFLRVFEMRIPPEPITFDGEELCVCVCERVSECVQRRIRIRIISNVNGNETSKLLWQCIKVIFIGFC